MGERRRVLGGDPGGDLGEAGVVGDERRHAGRGGLCRDHAERLGEDRRHDRDVRERQQVHEVAMLERAGEEHAVGCACLELRAVVAEADDDRAGVETLERVEEHLHALVLDQLPDVNDGRLVRGEEVAKASRVSRVGMTLVAVGRIAFCFRDQRGQSSTALLGRELVDVDARRHLVDAVDVPDDVLEHGPNVLGADVDRRGVLERLGAPALELGAAAHRVLELRPVGLHGVAQVACAPDRAAEEHVVREDEVGGTERAKHLRVRIHIGVALRPREVLQQLRS